MNDAHFKNSISSVVAWIIGTEYEIIIYHNVCLKKVLSFKLHSQIPDKKHIDHNVFKLYFYIQW